MSDWQNHKFQVLQSRTVYRGRAFQVRRDTVLFPHGREAELDIIDHNGAVTILPLDGRQNVIFIRQYRHAAGDILLELPAGTLEPQEDPAVCAQRELQEETGLRAATLTPLGSFFLAPGYSTEYMVVYLAQELSPAPLPGDEDEFLSTEPIPLQRAYEMARQGEIRDAKSLAALFLAAPYLKKVMWKE
ncbi:MAG: NUDIX hydrolase [Anaerolineae bacterium]|nr:MAG: NUDIX hydrolase [Anaerolineae bacterium]